MTACQTEDDSPQRARHGGRAAGGGGHGTTHRRMARFRGEPRQAVPVPEPRGRPAQWGLIRGVPAVGPVLPPPAEGLGGGHCGHRPARGRQGIPMRHLLVTLPRPGGEAPGDLTPVPGWPSARPSPTPPPGLATRLSQQGWDRGGVGEPLTSGTASKGRPEHSSGPTFHKQN